MQVPSVQDLTLIVIIAPEITMKVINSSGLGALDYCKSLLWYSQLLWVGNGLYKVVLLTFGEYSRDRTSAAMICH